MTDAETELTRSSASYRTHAAYHPTERQRTTTWTDGTRTSQRSLWQEITMSGRDTRRRLHRESGDPCRRASSMTCSRCLRTTRRKSQVYLELRLSTGSRTHQWQVRAKERHSMAADRLSRTVPKPDDYSSMTNEISRTQSRLQRAPRSMQASR